MQTRDLSANCCRYMLYEVMWKDSKADDSLSKAAVCKLYIGSCLTQLQVLRVLQTRLLFWQYSRSLLQSTLVIMGFHALPCPCQVVNSTCACLDVLFKFTLLHCICNHAVKYYNPVTHLCMLRCGTEVYRQVQVMSCTALRPLKHWCVLSSS